MDNLSNRVNKLKNVVIDIENAMKEDTDVVDSMTLSMDSVTNGMKGALTNLNIMGGGSGEHICYLVIMIIGLFLYLCL